MAIPVYPWPLATRFQVATADTIVLVAGRDGLATAVDVAILVVGIAVIVLAAFVVHLALKVGALSDMAGKLGTKLAGKSNPLLERGMEVADNVEFITRAIRTDVERLNASVRALTERLHHASDRMEERIEEFNALIEVVQSEAEAIFIDTASTVRGVTAGARAIPKPDAPRSRQGKREVPADPGPSADEGDTEIPNRPREVRGP